MAEDGNPATRLTSVEPGGIATVGTFNTPVGQTATGSEKPGDAFEFTINATPGQRLSLASMFVQSNDLFVSPNSDGIALFDSGARPTSGHVTGQLTLWDASTERNEPPGMGPNQAPRQSHGVPRDAAQVQADLTRLVALWDAGTEANQVPEVGANQAPAHVPQDLGRHERRSVDDRSVEQPSTPGGWTILIAPHATRTEVPSGCGAQPCSTA